MTLHLRPVVFKSLNCLMKESLQFFINVSYSFYISLKSVKKLITPQLQDPVPRISQILTTFNVSVNSIPDHLLPQRPPGIHTSHSQGVGFSPNFLCPRGRGFEIKNFSTVLKGKCRNFSICFKETGGSLKSRCSCAAVSYQFLQKQ